MPHMWCNRKSTAAGMGRVMALRAMSEEYLEQDRIVTAKDQAQMEHNVVLNVLLTLLKLAGTPDLLHGGR
jgi:ribosomal protein L17